MLSSKKFNTHMDGRGISCHELFPNADLEGQVNFSKIFPGVIKGFHFHKKQWDHWFCIDGNAHVIVIEPNDKINHVFNPMNVYKLHKDYIRFNGQLVAKVNHYYIGEGSQVSISIPPGSLHGYRSIGDKTATILYYVTEKYDGSDEYRIPFDFVGKELWEAKNE